MRKALIRRCEDVYAILWWRGARWYGRSLVEAYGGGRRRRRARRA